MLTIVVSLSSRSFWSTSPNFRTKNKVYCDTYWVITRNWLMFTQKEWSICINRPLTMLYLVDRAEKKQNWYPKNIKPFRRSPNTFLIDMGAWNCFKISLNIPLLKHFLWPLYKGCIKIYGNCNINVNILSQFSNLLIIAIELSIEVISTDIKVSSEIFFNRDID